MSPYVDCDGFTYDVTCTTTDDDADDEADDDAADEADDDVADDADDNDSSI